MRKIKETEYMYASARLRMLENRMVGRERVEALCDAKTGAEVRARLAEYGIAVGRGTRSRRGSRVAGYSAGRV